ncbi:MAG: Wzz/FepE/Etk N-terminal domain-containing protein [Rubrivivax sp.]
MRALPLPEDEVEQLGLVDWALMAAENKWLLLLGPLLTALLALGITYLIPPTYTATTTFLPPQQQSSLSATAMASLGALSGLVGNAGGLRGPGDEYVALMQSVTLADRIVDRFDLMKIYKADHRFEARRDLNRNVQITVGKKDALISVSVDDQEPQRAAAIANQYIVELRSVAAGLTLTEAQKRRAFFETQLEQTRDRLTAAQIALQSSGFNPGALKAEPRAAAERYAQLQAELTGAEVRLQTLRRGLADSAPEVLGQQAQIGALRSQLSQVERATPTTDGGPGYVGKYRDFKYQETLFDLFARQYEMARVDESREGALIQVVDKATPPEWKSRPKRAVIAIAAGMVALLLIVGGVALQARWRRSVQEPRNAAKLVRFRTARG